MSNLVKIKQEWEHLHPHWILHTTTLFTLSSFVSIPFRYYLLLHDDTIFKVKFYSGFTDYFDPKYQTPD